MTAIVTHIQKSAPTFNVARLNRIGEKIIEGFWFVVCLALFTILGPFSAPIVLGYLLFNQDIQGGLQEPESCDN